MHHTVIQRVLTSKSISKDEFEEIDDIPTEEKVSLISNSDVVFNANSILNESISIIDVNRESLRDTDQQS